MITADAVLHQLRGRWAIDRDIVGEGVKLMGEAAFESRLTGVLAYRETGVLTLADGREFNGSRDYLYRVDGDEVVVEFADGPDKGKTFVRFAFVDHGNGTLGAQGVHHCGRDVYRVALTLTSPDSFQMDIDVVGPSKAYRAITHYVRREETIR